MVNRFLLGIGLALALALAGCATKPASTAQAKDEYRPPAGCTYDTASRLPPRGPCGGVGSSYTGQDVNNTGRQDPNVGKSLQMLNPSVQSHP